MKFTTSHQGEIKKYEATFASRPLIVEIGRIANQTDGSCTVQFGDTVVLATAVMSNAQREGVDFFPLMVDYEERLYAAGIIKGSRWIKREGRPSDEAILSARLIDRSIRPLFDERIKNDIQVVLTVLSYDGQNDPDFPSMLAASIALGISRIPWNGPIAGLRLGQTNEDGKKEWVINPVAEVLEKCDSNVFVSGRDTKLIMIETDSKEVLEEDVFESVKLGMKEIDTLVSGIEQIVSEIGVEKTDIATLTDTAEVSEENEEKSTLEMIEITNKWLDDNVEKAMFSKELASKESRKEVIARLSTDLSEYLESQSIGKDRRKKAQKLFKPYIYKTVTQKILADKQRVDGRKLDEIRSLNVEVGTLPRTHGSGVFTRGQTQVMSVVTLGSPGDEQLLEGIDESGSKRYMHHYNFPKFSVGETGPMRSPGRREIGHGALAEKAVIPMLPLKDEFPYTIRVVSEVLSSNGSSSMGAVCGSSLALMDAGVPIKKPVAGIAMGLASDDSDKYEILTDLQDLEDGPGGMDFKLAGNRDGITAIQMDTKTLGLTLEIVEKTLAQGKLARLELLDKIETALKSPRADLSKYAPRIVTIKIDPDKIRDVIGPGGKIINEIIDKTGVQIDIEQDGTVLITSTEPEGSKRAVEWVESLTKEVQAGEVYTGKVSRIMDFGAFVDITPNQSGMIHISELAHQRVDKVTDIVKMGQEVTVKVIAIDDQGRVNLSLKALLKAGDDKHSGTNDNDKKPFRPRH